MNRAEVLSLRDHRSLADALKASIAPQESPERYPRHETSIAMLSERHVR
jgi:hypothetical protein